VLVKLHGTSGSGKTTIVRNIFDEASQILPIGPVSRPEAYKVTHPYLQRPLYILGPYENKCGGMDGVTSVDRQIELIERYAEEGHVLYEGLLLSTYYGRLGAITEKWGNSHIFAFLNTPIEECIHRVKARRAAAGNLRPLNEENTRKRIVPIEALKKKLIWSGRNVVTLEWNGDPTGQVLDLFEGGHDAG
jgi:hypothetical protein